MRQSIPVLRRVKMKDGGADVRVFRHPSRDVIRKLKWDVDEVLAAHGPDVAGYAVVIFGPDGASTVAQHAGGSIGSMTLPDFVRNRLLADRIERWTRDGILGPAIPDGAS